MKYYDRLDDRETYVIKSNETKPTINQLGVRIKEADTGKMYVNIDGNWVLETEVSNSSYFKTDGTLVNIADSFYKDEQIIGDIGDRQLRRGNMNVCGYTWSAVASNAYVILHIFVGSKPIYFDYEIASTGLTDYGAYRTPTITTAGTQLTSFTRNNVVTINPETLVYRDPTYSSLGTIVVPRFIGIGGNVVERQGGRNNEQYAILSAGQHLFLVAKNSGATTQDRMSISINWFEIDTAI